MSKPAAEVRRTRVEALFEGLESSVSSIPFISLAWCDGGGEEGERRGDGILLEPCCWDFGGDSGFAALAIGGGLATKTGTAEG